MPKEEFIAHDFNLPNHCNELSKAEELIDKLKKRFEIVQQQGSINDCTHLELFEEFVRCLVYVGKLSEVVFAIEEEIEAMYVLKYKHAPALGKQLWFEHYEELHHPYSLLKNRCYRQLELLDEEYLKVFHKPPPNINI